MAIGWMTVLQNVPWTDVVRNAPKVAAGAKKLWQSVRSGPAAAEVPATGSDAPVVTDPLALLQTQVGYLQARLAETAHRLEESSDLINTLAEQNAQLVAGVQALSRRVAWLSLVVLALGVSTALLYWR